MVLKVQWKISPWSKKSLEIKSYHFETFFSGLLSGSRYDFIQKRLGKSPIMVENAWEQRIFTTMQKGTFDIINTPDYIQYADA